MAFRTNTRQIYQNISLQLMRLEEECETGDELQGADARVYADLHAVHLLTNPVDASELERITKEFAPPRTEVIVPDNRYVLGLDLLTRPVSKVLYDARRALAVRQAIEDKLFGGRRVRIDADGLNLTDYNVN